MNVTADREPLLDHVQVNHIDQGSMIHGALANVINLPDDRTDP